MAVRPLSFNSCAVGSCRRTSARRSSLPATRVGEPGNRDPGSGRVGGLGFFTATPPLPAKVSARSGHPELAGRRHQPRQGGWLKQQNAAAPKRSLDRDMVSEKTARAQACRYPYNENALR
jgi:hypothetical protein